MAKALGSTPATAPHPHTHLLTPHLHGTVGLLFSPQPPSAILAYFSSFHPSDFARAGTIASRSFRLPPGHLYSRGGEIPREDDVPVGHSVEPNLRKLGVPTRLVKGRVEVEAEEGFEVCREGEVLGSGQTTLLKMFGVAMAEFSVGVRAWLDREKGNVTVVEGDGAGGGGGGMEVEGMDLEGEKDDQ
jgi:mRNA turnover protein 4